MKPPMKYFTLRARNHATRKNFKCRKFAYQDERTHRSGCFLLARQSVPFFSSLKPLGQTSKVPGTVKNNFLIKGAGRAVKACSYSKRLKSSPSLENFSRQERQLLLELPTTGGQVHRRSCINGLIFGEKAAPRNYNIFVTLSRPKYAHTFCPRTWCYGSINEGGIGSSYGMLCGWRNSCAQKLYVCS